MDSKNHHQHGEACNCVHGGSTSQTLEELDFERGIWSAAQNGDLERVRRFLAKGVDPDSRDSAGYTSLHYAARNDKLEVCRELLRRGADPNSRTRSGRATPLQRAAMQKNEEVVRLLLEAGADPNLQDDDGYTALHRSAMAGDLVVAEILRPITNLTLVDKSGWTARELMDSLRELQR